MYINYSVCEYSLQSCVYRCSNTVASAQNEHTDGQTPERNRLELKIIDIRIHFPRVEMYLSAVTVIRKNNYRIIEKWRLLKQLSITPQKVFLCIPEHHI